MTVHLQWRKTGLFETFHDVRTFLSTGSLITLDRGENREMYQFYRRQIGQMYAREDGHEEGET